VYSLLVNASRLTLVVILSHLTISPSIWHGFDENYCHCDRLGLATLMELAATVLNCHFQSFVSAVLSLGRYI